MMNDDLGDRMKLYEGMEASRRCLPGCPIIARLDGKGFHKYTKGLKRAFDERMRLIFDKVCEYLIERTHCELAYHQSDEITLIWSNQNTSSGIWFDGRIQKMCSVLASYATATFNRNSHLIGKQDIDAIFDCRVWSVPNMTEAANAVLWRELDATKNSISMAASAFYSHSELHGKNSSQKQEMLFQNGVNWDSYDPQFKKGTYIRKVATERSYTVDELSQLPPRHQARLNPGLKIVRSEFIKLDIKPLNKYTIDERIAILFGKLERKVEVGDDA